MASRGIPNFQNGREKGPYFFNKWVPLVEKLFDIPLYSEKYEVLFPRKPNKYQLQSKLRVNPNHDINYNQI